MTQRSFRTKYVDFNKEELIILLKMSQEQIRVLNNCIELLNSSKN